MIDAKVLFIAGKESEVESECRILRHAGCKVEVVTSLPPSPDHIGVVGEKNKVRGYFDVAFLKCSPAIDPLLILGKIKEKMAIPVVAILGQNEEELALKFVERGVDNYIIGGGKAYLLAPVVLERTLREERSRRALEDTRYEEAWREKLIDTAELTAGVVHEIRNPLSIIAMSVEYLVAKMDKDDPRRPFADAILRKVDKIESLIKNLVKFGRRKPPEFRSNEINRIILQVLELLMPKCEQLKITLAQELSEENPRVRADADLIEEVFLNLLNNAIDAMPGGGELTVRTYSQNETAVAEIGDTGNGIDGKEKEKIFLPFYSKKKGGTGLGLAISKRIVSEHGGKIWVEKAHQGGALFKFTIPRG